MALPFSARTTRPPSRLARALDRGAEPAGGSPQRAPATETDRGAPVRAMTVTQTNDKSGWGGRMPQECSGAA
jgi:hypothetical protein